MRLFRIKLSRLLATPLIAGTMLVGGCGGVQFEGKVFEAVGLTNDSSNREDAKVPVRAPLVLPPKRSLPTPGRPQQAATPQNWPDDPNERIRQAALAEKTKKKKCGEHDFKKKTSVEDIEQLADPLKGCEGFIGDQLKLGEKARGDGAPDTVTQSTPTDLSTKKELPTPWRTNSSQ